MWYNFAVPQRIRLMGRHRLCQQAARLFLDIKVFASGSLDAEFNLTAIAKYSDGYFSNVLQSMQSTNI